MPFQFSENKGTLMTVTDVLRLEELTHATTADLLESITTYGLCLVPPDGKSPCTLGSHG